MRYGILYGSGGVVSSKDLVNILLDLITIQKRR